MSVVDDLSDFFEEHKDIEVSFQSKRNFTDMKKLRSYITDLECAVRYFSGKSLDNSLSEFRVNRQKDKDNL